MLASGIFSIANLLILAGGVWSQQNYTAEENAIIEAALLQFGYPACSVRSALMNHCLCPGIHLSADIPISKANFLRIDKVFTYRCFLFSLLYHRRTMHLHHRL
jgi:hypothetical protein